MVWAAHSSIRKGVQVVDPHIAESLDKQGIRFGISPHSVDKAKAFGWAIESGEVALPIPQMEAENALMHNYLLPVLDLMIQYSDFVNVAVAWAASKGFAVSQDREVSIFDAS